MQVGRLGARVGLASATLAASVVWVAATGAVAAQPTDYACSELRVEQPAETAASPSRPFDLLHMKAAWDSLARRGVRAAGAGVGVAVLDSGVRPSSGLAVQPGARFTSSTAMSDYHGTAVAGLIAGRPRTAGLPQPLPVGFAPGARVIDVRTYDSSTPSIGGEVGPTPARLVAGLDWVAANARARNIGVATVAYGIPGSAPLRAAVDRVLAADVVLVAASGDRPLDESSPYFTGFAEYLDGEDAAGRVFPAGYPGVVAVNATAEGAGADVHDSVLQSSDVDIAAPTYGAVTASLSGGTCLLQSVSSGFAAAEVSGVVAMLRSRFPAESREQIVARLLDTASGATHSASPLTGRGVVQPREAVDRQLRPQGSGRLPEARIEDGSDRRAAAPEAEPDTLKDARRDAVWFGLFGVGAIVLAALLRPLLARHRS